VRIIRDERPQVVITYGDEQSFYPHPDHIRVHDATIPAFDAAGDPSQFPELGEPWQPQKLYYTGFSVTRVRKLHEAFLARGEESPYAEWFERGVADRPDRFTTVIDVGDFLDARRRALLAHRTQIDPDGFWMRLPDDVLREVWPYEEFVLARSLVPVEIGEGEYETDLFAGLR
jgi:mycothiol S-conjugate amidase